MEEVSSRLQIGLMAGGEHYNIGTGTYKEAGFFIAKPLTYMNESGFAVARIIREHDIPLDRLIVVCDDCYLPIGKIRIRRSGSDGGHNGLASIIDSLDTEAFARLRVGIGSPPPDVDLIEYVLDDFPPEEEKIIQEAVLRAAEAILCILSDGLEQAMNTFN